MGRTLLALSLLTSGTALGQEGPVAPDAPEADASAESTDTVADPMAGIDPALSALRSELERHQNVLEAQAAQIEAQQELIEAQAARIDKQGVGLAKVRGQLIPPDAATFDLEGYYRTRGYRFRPLYADQQGAGSYMAHRLKLRPVVDYKGLAKFAMEVDAFGHPQFGGADVVWGDNQNRQLTPLFAGDPSATNLLGEEGVGGPVITRAWTEVSIPVGLIRVGRQPSSWGMGLLSNDGNGFDDTFGENHYGSTFDRAIFATKPISIFNAIAGRPDKEIPLFFAVGVDRLVEDPLHQYYGYKCNEGDTEDDRTWDARCDTDGDGVADEDHSFVDESPRTEQRANNPSWWADNDDDVYEVVYVLIYRGEELDKFGGGNLTAGVYAVNRIQRESNSKLWIADAYVKAEVKGVYAEFEGLTIQGRTSSIALPGTFDPSGQTDDPLAKTADIWGYSARLGYVQPSWKAILETGMASGDANIIDENFTARGLHPDHNVGLILYEQVLAQVTRDGFGEAGQALWSNGGVWNSHYIFPTATYELMDNWNLVGGFLVALPQSPDGAFFQCLPGEGCAQSDATSNILGWEADLALKIRWHKHMLFSLETGYAHATDRIALATRGLPADGNFFTVQSRIAYQFGPLED